MRVSRRTLGSVAELFLTPGTLLPNLADRTAGQRRYSRLMSSETLAPLDTDVLARRFACLGDPTRLRVLRLAAGGPIDVDTIAHAASLEPSALSAHLEALIEVGFVEASVREGTFGCQCCRNGILRSDGSGRRRGCSWSGRRHTGSSSR